MIGAPPPAAARPIPVDALSLGRARLRPSPPGPLVDGQRRSVRYLRLSVTDRCNFRCQYCLPAEGVPHVPRSELLSFEEIERVVRSFVALGVTHVRLTGGEPLLRRDLPDLVRRIATLEGVEDVAMTTNAFLLAPMARDLAAAGLRRINISIDTLRPDRFRDITRIGSLERVLEGIEAARDAGLHPLKLNAVVVRGFNDDELGDLVRFAARQGAVLRFIEYMPIGVDGFWSDATFVDADEILATLARDFDVADPLGFGPAAGIAGEGPAVYRDLTPRGGGPTTRVGFVTALSHAFCAACNRVRVTATGTIQECLAVPGVVSLRDALRSGADDASLRQVIEEALWLKSEGHRFEVVGGGVHVPQAMSVTGG